MFLISGEGAVNRDFGEVRFEKGTTGAAAGGAAAGLPLLRELWRETGVKKFSSRPSDEPCGEWNAVSQLSSSEDEESENSAAGEWLSSGGLLGGGSG